MTEPERRNPERVATLAEIAEAKLTFREEDDPEMQLAVPGEIGRLTEERRAAFIAATTEGNPADSASAQIPAPQTTPQPESTSKEPLPPEQIEAVVTLLKHRFDDPKNKNLCPTLSWEKAEKTLRATPKALGTVLKAEQAGHEPTICFSDETGFEIATRLNETPQSTRDCVYDKKAEQWRKEEYPHEQFKGNAVSQARKMGWALQEAGLAEHIASNTSDYKEQGISWFKTDWRTRKLGLVFGGNRNGGIVKVSLYNAYIHRDNRGWRGSLRVNFVS